LNTNHQVEMKKHNPTVKTFENYGSIFGFLLGAIAGVLLAGPNFQVWTPFESFLTILGGGVVVGVIGHIALAMSLGAVAAGNLSGDTNPSTDNATSSDVMCD
jgi:hypothetical protein